MGVVAIKEDEKRSRTFAELYGTIDLLKQLHIALADVFVKFSLSLDHSLKRTEALDVRFAHIGDDAAVGLYDVAEHCNLAHVVGSGFNNGKFVFVSESKQGERHPYVVVEIALGVEHAESLGEHSRY